MNRRLSRCVRSPAHLCFVLATLATMAVDCSAQLELTDLEEGRFFVDAAVTTRQLWRGYDQGSGLTFEPRVGLSHWLTGHLVPHEQALLLDADAQIAMTSTDVRRGQDQYRVTAQYLFTRGPVKEPWEFRLGLAEGFWPRAPQPEHQHATELSATVLWPTVLESEVSPIRPYAILSWEFERFDGPMIQFGAHQGRHLGSFDLDIDAHLALSGYRNDIESDRRPFSPHVLSLGMFLSCDRTRGADRTFLHCPVGLRGGPWNTYGFFTEVDAPAPDVTRGIRALIGVKISGGVF